MTSSPRQRPSAPPRSDRRIRWFGIACTCAVTVAAFSMASCATQASRSAGHPGASSGTSPSSARRPSGHAYAIDLSLRAIVAVKLARPAVERVIPFDYSGTAIAVSRGGQLLYALTASNTLVRVNRRTGKVEGTLVLGPAQDVVPDVLALTPDGRSAIVIGGDRVLIAVDLRTWAVARRYVVLAGVGSLAVSPDGTKIFVINGGAIGTPSNTLSELDLRSGAVLHSIVIAGGLEDVTVTSSYVVVVTSARRLYALQPTTLRVDAVMQIPGPFVAFAIPSTGDLIYAVDGDPSNDNSSYSTIDVARRTVSAPTALPDAAGFLNVVPRSAPPIGVAAVPRGLITVDLSSGKVLGRVTFGKVGPRALAVTPQ